MQYDESGWPIIVVTLPARSLNDGEFLDSLNVLSDYSRRGRIGFVLDVRNCPLLSADRRRSIAERMDQDAKIHGYKCPVAIVLNSSIQVGVVQVLSWLAQTKPLISMFGNVDEARVWIRKMLEESSSRHREDTA